MCNPYLKNKCAVFKKKLLICVVSVFGDYVFIVCDSNTIYEAMDCSIVPKTGFPWQLSSLHLFKHVPRVHKMTGLVPSVCDIWNPVLLNLFLRQSLFYFTPHVVVDFIKNNNMSIIIVVLIQLIQPLRRGKLHLRVSWLSHLLFITCKNVIWNKC